MASEKHTVYGYDGLGYQVGDRVELHPGCDLWMRGAKFGTVVTVAYNRVRERVYVELDATGRKIKGEPSRFKRID